MMSKNVVESFIAAGSRIIGNGVERVKKTKRDDVGFYIYAIESAWSGNTFLLHKFKDL